MAGVGEQLRLEGTLLPRAESFAPAHIDGMLVYSNGRVAEEVVPAIKRYDRFGERVEETDVPPEIGLSGLARVIKKLRIAR